MYYRIEQRAPISTLCIRLRAMRIILAVSSFMPLVVTSFMSSVTHFPRNIITDEWSCRNDLRRQTYGTRCQTKVDISLDRNHDVPRKNNNNLIERRFILDLAKFTLCNALSINVSEVDAACLSGDIREDCIGVYKMPLDDAALPYIETPDQLKKFAPDLVWVPPIQYPPTYKMALDQVKQQRVNFDAVTENILKGDLKLGGLLLLDIIPKVHVAGKVIIQSFTDAANDVRRNSDVEIKRQSDTFGTFDDVNYSKTLDMKAYRIDYALNELLAYLGEVDVLIGQGLRGQLGVSAPAQIQILASLNEVKTEFDEFIRVIPDTVDMGIRKR